MQQNFASGEACCFTGRPASVDPMDVDNVVPAGDVCGASKSDGGCRLAAIYFPSQTYRAGYRPEEALQRGSLFPELVFSQTCNRREG